MVATLITPLTQVSRPNQPQLVQVDADGNIIENDSLQAFSTSTTTTATTKTTKKKKNKNNNNINTMNSYYQQHDDDDNDDDTIDEQPKLMQLRIPKKITEIRVYDLINRYVDAHVALLLIELHHDHLQKQEQAATEGGTLDGYSIILTQNQQNDYTLPFYDHALFDGLDINMIRRLANKTGQIDINLFHQVLVQPPPTFETLIRNPHGYSSLVSFLQQGQGGQNAHVLLYCYVHIQSILLLILNVVDLMRNIVELTQNYNLELKEKFDYEQFSIECDDLNSAYDDNNYNGQNGSNNGNNGQNGQKYKKHPRFIQPAINPQLYQLLVNLLGCCETFSQFYLENHSHSSQHPPSISIVHKPTHISQTIQQPNHNHNGHYHTPHIHTNQQQSSQQHQHGQQQQQQQQQQVFSYPLLDCILCAITPHLSGSFCDGNRILHSHLTQLMKPLDLTVFTTWDNNENNNNQNQNSNTIHNNEHIQSNTIASSPFDTIFNNVVDSHSNTNILSKHQPQPSHRLNSNNIINTQHSNLNGNVLDSLHQASLVSTFTNPRSQVQQPNNNSNNPNSKTALNFIASEVTQHTSTNDNQQPQPISISECATPDFTNLLVGSSSLPPIQLTTAISSHHTPRTTTTTTHNNSNNNSVNMKQHSYLNHNSNIINSQPQLIKSMSNLNQLGANNDTNDNNNNHDGSIQRDFSMLIDKSNASSLLQRSYRAQHNFHTHIQPQQSSRTTTTTNSTSNNNHNSNNIVMNQSISNNSSSKEDSNENSSSSSTLFSSASGLFKTFSFSKQFHDNTTNNQTNITNKHMNPRDQQYSKPLPIFDQVSTHSTTLSQQHNDDSNNDDNHSFQQIDANTGQIIVSTPLSSISHVQQQFGSHTNNDNKKIINNINTPTKKLPNGERPSGLSTSMSSLHVQQFNNNNDNDITNNNQQKQSPSSPTSSSKSTPNSIHPDDLLFFYIQNQNLHLFQKSTQIVTTLYNLLKELEKECTASLSVHYSLYSTSLQWKVLYYRIMTINHWCNILYACDLTEDLIL